MSMWSSELQRDTKLTSHDITCNVSPCDMLCLYIYVYNMCLRYFQMYSWPLVPNCFCVDWLDTKGAVSGRYL